MKYKITYSLRFKKHFKKLTTSEKSLINRKLEFLIENPMHPSLRTKKIKGIDGIWESSINMDLRVIWLFEGETIIFLIDIGHHDILNKF